MPAPLELYLLTFNCGRALIDPKLLGTNLFTAWPKDRQDLPDVLAISLQEVAPIAYSFLGGRYLLPYLERVEESVRIAGGRSGGGEAVYERLEVHNVGMTVTMVFVRQEIKDRVTRMETAGVGVGAWEMGNKGGVGIRVTIDDKKEITFVGMHLAPMEGMVIRRNQDWENICRGLVFSAPASAHAGSTGENQPLLSKKTASSPPTGLYKPHTHIFLFGDLNYRTSHLPPTPQSHKSYPQPSHVSPSADRIAVPDLLIRDELTQERIASRTLHGFAEQPITFPPTYKYSPSASLPGPTASQDPSTEALVVKEPSAWTWAKHRWPSWCDRILFYPPTNLVAGIYTALPLLPSSDHRGVALHVTLDLNGEEEEIDHDLRLEPPFPIDPNWEARRAVARRYEIVVGVASWFALTAEGNASLAVLLASGLGVVFLVRMFGMGEL